MSGQTKGNQDVDPQELCGRFEKRIFRIPAPTKPFGRTGTNYPSAQKGDVVKRALPFVKTDLKLRRLRRSGMNDR